MSITTSLYIPIDKTSTLTPSEEKGDSVQDTELKAKTLTMADIQKISWLTFMSKFSVNEIICQSEEELLHHKGNL